MFYSLIQRIISTRFYTFQATELLSSADCHLGCNMYCCLNMRLLMPVLMHIKLMTIYIKKLIYKKRFVKCIAWCMFPSHCDLDSNTLTVAVCLYPVKKKNLFLWCLNSR